MVKQWNGMDFYPSSIFFACFSCFSVDLKFHNVVLRLEGNYLFTGVVSVTLNFHPQGRNVNVVTNEGKS